VNEEDSERDRATGRKRVGMKRRKVHSKLTQ